MAKIYCKSSYLLRRDTAANWNAKNPILREGEEGYETDTGKRQVGDGTTEWNNLKYDSGIVDQTYSPDSENAQSGKAVAEAVATEQNRADNTFANALKGSKSGSAILIDDVSPVTHDMSVKISSDTVEDLTAVKVTRCGKNLIPYPYDISGTTQRNGLTITVNEDGSIIINGTATADTYIRIRGENSQITVSPGKYTFSGCANGGGQNTYKMYTEGTFFLYSQPNPATINNTKYGSIRVLIVVYKNVVCDNIIFKPQLEPSTTATKYEPYKTPTEYTPAADGTVSGVKSLYPTTTLMTDTEGTIIEVEYNKDINKAFAEIQQAIISLGGNV